MKGRDAVIRDYGEEAFRRLIGEAVVILKEDRRLVGLDRLRLALARAACMRAVSGEVRSFVVPRELYESGGEVSPGWCNELVSACAVRLHLDGKV